MDLELKTAQKETKVSRNASLQQLVRRPGWLLGALLPLEVVNLGELEIGRVNGEQGSLRARGRDADLGVDVQQALLAARRPDGALDAELVRLEIVVGVWPAKRESARDLLGVAREVVGRLAGARDATGDLRIAAIVGLEDGELPALREAKLDVELAVLAELGGGDARARLSDEAVVQEGDCRQVAGELAGDAARGAAGACKGKSLDRYLVTGRRRRAIGQDGCGSCGGQASEDGEDERDMHVGVSR